MQLNTPSTTQQPSATFTGEVLMTPLATGEQPSRLSVAHVRFTPGARTHWHVHPLGQVLHVTDGTALLGTVTAPSVVSGTLAGAQSSARR